MNLWVFSSNPFLIGFYFYFFVYFDILRSSEICFGVKCEVGASQVALVLKKPTYQCRRQKKRGFDPWVGKIPWRRAEQSTPVFLPGESHGQKPGRLQSMGHTESDMTEET